MKVADLLITNVIQEDDDFIIKKGDEILADNIDNIDANVSKYLGECVKRITPKYSYSHACNYLLIKIY